MMRAANIRWNVLANFVGQSWRAGMALLFVPFYLRILGVEAYGLVGLYTSLQLALALLDAGMRPTLAREMARFTGGGSSATAIRTLLRSVELPFVFIAVAIVAIMVLTAPWLAEHWVHPEHLSHGDVTQAFMVMGLVAAAQLAESLYDSCLTGLQRQVLQNAIITVIATLRGFGALLVISLVPSVSAFFAWQAAVAVVSLAALAIAVYRALPPPDVRVRFAWSELARVRRYAAETFAIAVVALLLTQSDRVLLAKFLPLSDVGRYTLAATLAGALAFLSTPVLGAFYPRLTELVERGERAALIATFHLAVKLTATLVGTATAMLVAFGEPLLQLWVHNDALTAHVAPVLALLALAGLFNVLTAGSYFLQLAHGVTRWTLRINLVLLAAFIPGLIMAVSRFGALGAAGCATALNLAGMIASSTVTFSMLLPGEARRWWLGDLAAILLPVFAAAGLLRMVVPSFPQPALEAAAIAASGLIVLACGVLADATLRKHALRLGRRNFHLPLENRIT